MRARPFVPALSFFAFFAALASVPLVPLACVSSNPTVTEVDSGGISLDSGSSSADGSVPGDSASADSSSSDAATSDGSPTDGATGDGAADGAKSPDGATNDGGPGPVTVTVVTPSGPESGVTVVFQSAAGTVITSAVTGSSGSVTETVPSGSEITAILGTAIAPSLVTIMAVEPGDSLTVLDTTAVTTGPTETVDVPSLPTGAPGATTGYRVYATAVCDTDLSTSFPLVMNLEPQCATAAGLFPALAVADGPSGELAFFFQNGNNALPDGGPPEGGVLDLTMSGTWTTSGTQTLTASNLPTTVLSEGVLAFTEVAEGLPYTQASSINVTDAGPVTQSFASHPGYPDFVQSEVNVLASNSDIVSGGETGNWQSMAAIATRTSTTSPASFDLSQLLPIVTAAGVGYDDPTHPTVSWTTSAPVTTADAVIAVITWSGTTGGTWTIVAPATTTLLQVPSLPTGNTLGPPSTASYSQTPLVILMDASFWSGYADARGGVSGVMALTNQNSDYAAQAIVPPLPVDGTLNLSELNQIFY
jgi:hypothetical protein